MGQLKPKYLVLGFSKGATQAKVFRDGDHNKVAFAKMRPRLAQVLTKMSILEEQASIDDCIENPESEIAFASLVRCSLTRFDEKQSLKQGTPVFASSGNLVTKSFDEIPHILNACVDEYLSDLPSSLTTVFFLGCADKYVKGVKSIFKRKFSTSYQDINPMAFEADNRKWIFTAHPSPANGTFSQWIDGIGTSGNKMQLATQALSIAGLAQATKLPKMGKEEKNMDKTTPAKPAISNNNGSFKPVEALPILQSHCSLIGETKKISGFMTTTGKNIALQKERSTVVQVWIEYEAGKDPKDLGFKVRNRSNPDMPYSEEQARSSNLRTTTAPRLQKGRAVWNVEVPTKADFLKLLEWYK